MQTIVVEVPNSSLKEQILQILYSFSDIKISIPQEKKRNKNLIEFEQLQKLSNNKISVTRENSVNTEKMTDDLS